MTMSERAKSLNDAQQVAMMRMLAMAMGTKDGRVSEYQARFGGVNLIKLRFLVRHGLLVKEYGDFVMPTGPYAGQTFREPFYSIAE